MTPDYNIDDTLPWRNIHAGCDEKFLKIENKRMKTLKQTPWCEKINCYNCGACEKK